MSIVYLTDTACFELSLWWTKKILSVNLPVSFFPPVPSHLFVVTQLIPSSSSSLFTLSPLSLSLSHTVIGEVMCTVYVLNLILLVKTITCMCIHSSRPVYCSTAKGVVVHHDSVCSYIYAHNYSNNPLFIWLTLVLNWAPIARELCLPVRGVPCISELLKECAYLCIQVLVSIPGDVEWHTVA